MPAHDTREFVVSAEPHSQPDSTFAQRSTGLTLASAPQPLVARSGAQTASTPPAVVNVAIPIETPGPPPAPEVDVNRVADEVYGLLVSRLSRERDRRGY
jgi:hypothetical protein